MPSFNPRTFCKLLAIVATCYPAVAFASPRISSNGIRSHHIVTPYSTSKLHLHLRIPRGGSIEDEISSQQEEQPEVTPEVTPEVQQVISDPVPTKENPVLKMALLPVSLTSALQCFGSSYSNALSVKPILTKSLTACLTFFLSDYVGQKVESDEKNIKTNWTRALCAAAVGLFYFGPAAHYWYEMVFTLLPSTSMASTLQKALLGQVIFGPLFTCVFFATFLLQGGNFSLGNWAKKIKKDLPGAWLAGVGFWPFIDIFSYALVPVKWIPLFINFCSFIWTIYLSTVASRAVSD